MSRWTATFAAFALVALVALGGCGSSGHDGGQAGRAGSDPAATAANESTAPPKTLARSTEVPGSQPAGDLAFLGPAETVPVGDITVGYRQFGSGPPLVLVVGQDSSMSYWGPDVLRLLAEQFTVTMFDNRGVGLSTDPGTEPLTIPLMGDDLVRLIGALGLDQPTVFGWSTGGEIALAAAVRHPGVIGRVALSGATAGGRDATPTPPELDAMMASTDPVVQAHLLDELFTPSGAAARSRYIDGLLRMPDEPITPEAVDRQAQAEAAFVTDQQTADGLGGIAVPVLVTDGAADRLVPPANATAIAAAIPGAQLVLEPDTSHAWMLQEPERFVALLVAFVAGEPLP